MDCEQCQPLPDDVRQDIDQDPVTIIHVKLEGPKGLGDAIYLRAIALHLIENGLTVKVFTVWPRVFKGLPVITDRAENADRDGSVNIAAACYHCRNPAVVAMDQFTRLCLQAGLGRVVDLRIAWEIRNPALLAEVMEAAAGRPILLYQPVKVSDTPDKKLLRPRRDAFNAFVSEASDYFRVKIGHPRFTHLSADLPCELDLYGKTTVEDVFDLASISDHIFGEGACYLPILAQAMDRPFTAMFSRRGMAAANRIRVSAIRPGLVFHKHHLATAVYDEPA